MDQPSAESMLRALDRFVGEWTMAASPPGGPPWPGSGHVHFEWMDGEDFLLQRWLVDMPEAPNGSAIIGVDSAHGTYVQLYSDERRVYRIYTMGLDGDVWTLRRDGPPFSQRFTGTFSADGATITGRWELAEEGEDWRTDFDLVYTCVA